jgi:hypothetical protein
MRWWIASLPVSRLLSVGFGALFGYALVGAAVKIATSLGSQSVGARFLDAGTDFRAVLDMFRASLGDPLSIDENSAAQQLLATVTSVVGIFVPAIIIGVVLIRLFSISPFTWRKKIAICLESECDFDDYADEHADSRNAMMTIRFYNRFTNLRIADMTCQVFVHYVAHSSDNSGTFHKITVKQLDGAGRPAVERKWPTAEQGAPFTVWIPLEAPVDELPVRSIQGRRIDDKREAKLLVRVTAKTAGLGTDIVEEHWYKLDDAESVELGRYAPIDVDPAVPIELWGGWADFEGLRGPAIVPSQPSPAVDDAQQDPERPEGVQTTGS